MPRFKLIPIGAIFGRWELGPVCSRSLLDDARAAAIRHATESKQWTLRALNAERELDTCREKNLWCINEIERLKNELEQWTKWGIIEIAIRNPNVAAYMEHWEQRALKAERELDKFLHTGSGSDL